MKKTFLITLLLFSIQFIFGQEVDQNNLNIAKNFEKKFNSSDYNGIFEMFSAEMKSALPTQEANKYFADLKKEVGGIKCIEFKKYVRGSFASYKTTFDKAVLAVNISTDKSSKITVFLLMNLRKIICRKSNGILPN